MSPTSTDRITLTGSQRRELTRMTRAGRTEQRLVTRAQIVLAAAAGESNAQIAGVASGMRGHRAQVAPPLVRGTGCGVVGRCEAIGRPPVFSPVQVARSQGDGLHAPPRTAGYRCRAGRARSWPSRSSPTESASRSRRRRYAGGCRRTRSNRGSISRGSSSPIPTSPPKPNGYSTLRPRVGRGTVGPQRLRDLGR